ncbi:MAG: leucine-rich repeat protein, partial [Clostridia bacterium]|nr:leucine-rich repeat protein [Clostridia bacterium]
LLATVLCGSALAATDNVDFCSLIERVDVTAGKLGKAEKETLPVYCAPDESGYRSAGGKAAVSLREPFDALGISLDGNWLLVEYTYSGKDRRTGWIRIGDSEQPAAGSVYEWDLYWDRDWTADRDGDEKQEGPITSLQEIGAADLMTVTLAADLTDEPNGKRRPLRRLMPGEMVGGLGTFTAEDGTDFVYVRTEVDGKKAFGFLPVEAVRFCPNAHMDGDTLVIEDGIEFLGLRQDLLDSSGFMYRDGGPVKPVLETGMIQGYPWDEINPGEEEIRAVHLPSSLRVIGEDALYYMDLDELVIPEGVRYIRGLCPFLGMRIGTLYLPSTLEDFRFYLRLTNVGTYVLAEENPRMTCVEGALFSADGTILLSYPNARAADSYDVPKGTEIIAEHAFYVGPYYDGAPVESVPLRALSLPLGLKEVGYEAFAGLDELISLTILPTVETLSDWAFGEMASLQFLNMPEHLKNRFYARWSESRKDRKFTGDNGEETGEQ